MYWRSADVSANDLSMRSPGRYIGAAGMNAPPTPGPVLVVNVQYRLWFSPTHLANAPLSSLYSCEKLLDDLRELPCTRPPAPGVHRGKM